MIPTLPDIQELPGDGDVVAAAASDRELIARFLAGEEAAFAELVQRHAGLVGHACRRVLAQANDVDGQRTCGAAGCRTGEVA